VKAAALSYFGVEDLSELTVAQAAILAALPKSPSNYDLVRNAIEECTEPANEEGECGETRLVVPADTTVVQRRNQILELMANGDRTPRSGDQYTRQDFLDAIEEPVVLVPQTTARWKAPHFIWRVRDELASKLCGEDSTCPPLDQGGLRVTTTIDSRIQGIAEKWVKSATIVPRQDDIEAAAERLDLPYGEWMRNLADKRLRNGAIVAVDYQTGEVIAYVGSADYYATNSTSRFQPKYDVAGEGYRQPGSAFKPFNYAIGIDSKAMTAGTVLMDAATDFGNGFTPNNADQLERGPVRVRSALQFSLNIPSVKAVAINDPATVFTRAQDFGMEFRGDASQAGLSLALGTQETPPIDLVTAYATLANGGRYIGHTTILTVTDRDGTPVMDPYEAPAGEQVVSPQAAFIVTDILNGNTQRRVNPYWGEFFIEGPEGKRRPATLKTGTNNDAKDLNAYGYIAAPTRAQREDGAYALAVGAWNGNSDNTEVSTPDKPLFSIEVSTYVWQGFLTEASADWPVRSFSPPEEGLTQATIDPFTGFLARPGQEGVEEWFISGTEPTARFPADACGPDALDELAHEDRSDVWLEADRDWIARARRGPGTSGGPRDTQVSYFYNNGFNPYGRSWGPLLGRGCGTPAPSATCFPVPGPDASGVTPSFTLPSPGPSGVAVVPCSPPPSASEAPSVEPSAPPSEPPSPTPPPVTPPPVTPPPVTPPPVTPPPVTPPPVTPPPVTPVPSAPPPAVNPAQGAITRS
jgi:membrane peptidoglycan carboxypeptidase